MAAGARNFVYFSSILASDAEQSSYAHSKWASEEFLRSISGTSSETHAIILRSANVYGPGMSGSIHSLIRLMHFGLLPSLPRLERVFTMVSVKDLCAAAIAVSEDQNLNTESVTFTVTDGEDYTLNRIESAVYSCLNRARPRWRIPRAGIFIAALFGHTLTFAGLGRNLPNLRQYRRLVIADKLQHSTKIHKHFETTATIESEMPKILSALNGRQI